MIGLASANGRYPQDRSVLLVDERLLYGATRSPWWVAAKDC
jgi:hypothetical protein